MQVLFIILVKLVKNFKNKITTNQNFKNEDPPDSK